MEESRLVTTKPELCDMMHALVPTRLPAAEFYRQMALLYSDAVPRYRAFPVLFRFGWHGMLIRIRVYNKFLQGLRAAHLDY
jgi:hypothetical protein